MAAHRSFIYKTGFNYVHECQKCEFAGKKHAVKHIFLIFFGPKLLTIQKFCVPLQCKSRDGAVVARWAHNPKVVSSSLAPATKNS